MKKLFLAAVALAIIAFAPSSSNTATNEQEIHFHNHAEAASITWQCRNCGTQIYQSDRAQPPSSSYGCGGEWNKRHIWERLN